MHLIARLTNRLILESGTDRRGERLLIYCGSNELSYDVRKLIAARLYNDKYLCEATVNNQGGVVPRLDHCDHPVLLRVDGKELADVVNALEADERDVQDYLARRAGAQKTI